MESGILFWGMVTRIQTRIRVRSKGTIFSAMEVSILGVGSFFFFFGGGGLVFCSGDDDCT